MIIFALGNNFLKGVSKTMTPYLIYTDSAADLPSHAYKEYDIRIVPMDYMLNGKSITFYTESETHDEECGRLYEAQRQGTDVHTSQITPYRYSETWDKDLAEGYDILYLAMSSGLSATYINALTAAEELKDKYPDRTVSVVDSLAATGGQGLLTYTAAMNREAGMSLEENTAWLNKNVPFLCHRFVVGDLDYLHKGGRVSAAVAVIGGMLSIKPLLIIDDEGKLPVVGKSRGINAAMKSLVKSYQNERGVENVPDLVYITHSALYDKANDLAQMIRNVTGPDTKIEVICQTPIIGVHTGPEFFSVCGWGKHRKES